jgi:hypothetical protein
MKKVILGLIFLINASFCLAQATTGKNIDDHLLIKDAQKNLGLEDPIDVVGTPYLNERFADGEVVFEKGIRNQAQLRYNIYKDWMEFQQNNQTFILDPDRRIKEVQIDQNTFIVKEYRAKGKATLGYFMVLDSGQITLLAKPTVVYKEYQQAQALQSSSTPPKYTRTADQYYYLINGNQLKKVDNVKNMIADFPDKQDALTDFAKKEKISAKDGEELKKLVSYYKTL